MTDEMEINENPTGEKIVRCSVCRYYEPHIYRHFTCELLTLPVGKGGFCALGERREEGKRDNER